MPGPLIGEWNLGPAEIAAWTAAAAVAGGGGKWVLDRVSDWWQTRMGYRERADNSLNARLERWGSRLESELAAERRRGRASEVRLASLIGHLRYMESLLKNAGVAFAPWVDPTPDGSAEFDALVEPHGPAAPAGYDVHDAGGPDDA